MFSSLYRETSLLFSFSFEHFSSHASSFRALVLRFTQNVTPQRTASNPPKAPIIANQSFNSILSIVYLIIILLQRYVYLLASLLQNYLNPLPRYDNKKRARWQYLLPSSSWLHCKDSENYSIFNPYWKNNQEQYSDHPKNLKNHNLIENK